MGNISFEFCKPEDVGIPSENVSSFLQIIKEKKICMHSILMMHKGKVFYEEYAKPYDKDSLQRMYSISKTYTAVAVGILADDKVISLDDKVVDYFTDMADENTHPYIKETTIRELLMMAGPFGSLKGFDRSSDDWTKSYFSKKPDYPSGTLFYYDTSGTRILCAMVERITKKPLMEFLKERIFDELGYFKNSRCLQTPDGFSHGGSGVLATLRDLAVSGSLIMNGGVLNGKRYLSEEFVKEMVSPLVFNDNDALEIRTHKGYGYYVWCMKSGFAFKGMGSQQVICVPEKDFMFCCTADTQGNKIHYEGLYDYLFFEIIDKIEPIDTKTIDLSLEFIPVDGKKYIPLQDKINNVTYKLNENKMGISELTLSFLGDKGSILLKTPRGDKKIDFGMGEFLESTFPETHYSGEIMARPSGEEYKCTSAAAWVSDYQLSIRTYTLGDYLGNLYITIGFKGNKIGLRMVKNAEFFFEEYEGCAGGETILPIKL